MAKLELDGTWARILPDGTLELRDPNSGVGSDPETKPRHQYRVEHWLLLRRVLPAVSVGDRWLGDEIDAPWWEPVLELPRVGGPIVAYYESRSDMPAHRYARDAQYAAGHVALYTPNGRAVRRTDRGYEVQPRNDNYWIACADLPAARRAFFGRS